MNHLQGRRILVTGGCGSIGHRLVGHILDQDPEFVRVLDSDESGLFQLKRKFSERADQLRLLLGDVRDHNRVVRSVKDIDVVFHAAALKHVGLNEYNPIEAVQTNVAGTQNLIQASIDADVDTFVATSTDKAPTPSSVMGATKLLAERLVIAANNDYGDRRTTFGCVRFGNVLGSSGSVIPVFLDQLSEGGPLTVTDPDMTRFIMPVHEAVDLVLEAQRKMEGGEVFVLKMPTFELSTLVDVVRQKYAPWHGYDPDDINVKIIGRRPGERMHEKLIASHELPYTEERENMFVLHPQIDLKSLDNRSGSHSLESEYTSEHPEPYSASELSELFEQSDVLPSVSSPTATSDD